MTDNVQFHISQLEQVYTQVKSGHKSYAQFAEAIDSIDWPSHSADNFKTAIEMALSLDNVRLARKLSQIGIQTHPEDEQLQKIAKAIAPPRIVKTGRPAKPSLAPTMQWFEEHAHEHRGQWVAIQNGTLLGTNTKRRLLIEELGDDLTEDTLITRIPE